MTNMMLMMANNSFSNHSTPNNINTPSISQQSSSSSSSSFGFVNINGILSPPTHSVSHSNDSNHQWNNPTLFSLDNQKSNKFDEFMTKFMTNFNSNSSTSNNHSINNNNSNNNRMALNYGNFGTRMNGMD